MKCYEVAGGGTWCKDSSELLMYLGVVGGVMVAALVVAIVVAVWQRYR
jgi:hypothetical protein